jgi:predicted dehydrogenase
LNQIRIAVIGVGSFGRNHVRVLQNSPNARLVGIVDTDRDRAAVVGAEFSCPVLANLDDLNGQLDAAVVAVPTSAHRQVGCRLMEQGVDVLIEKPIAGSLADAQALVAAAREHHRVLHIGHLERFNPAVIALKKVSRLPLFFEIHRMSLFSPRSLDVDVVLDLMIHDLDIVLDLVGKLPEEIRAAGICILSEKVDIANVRLAFPGGCVANLTASRVSTERVRKVRLFQPEQYISLDYQRQDGAIFSVSGNQQIGYQPLAVAKDEPLKLELESFLQSVASRKPGGVSGEEGVRVLALALAILDKIEEHTRTVAHTLQALR